MLYSSYRHYINLSVTSKKHYKLIVKDIILFLSSQGQTGQILMSLTITEKFYSNF